MAPLLLSTAQDMVALMIMVAIITMATETTAMTTG